MSVTRNYGVYYAPTGNANTEARTVSLDMASGNQFIDSNYGTYLASVTVTKPATLIPANIRENINIGGVIGTLVEGIIPEGNVEINQRSGTDVTNYATASVKSGSVTFTTENFSFQPTITVSSGGLITAAFSSGTQTLTPSVVNGWISNTPRARFTASGSKTQQLNTIAAQTITPGTSDQTLTAGNYLTGTQTILGDADLIPENIAQGVTIFGVQGIHGPTGEIYQISTIAQMDELLISANANKAYQYIGASGVSSTTNRYYHQNNIYIYEV